MKTKFIKMPSLDGLVWRCIGLMKLRNGVKIKLHFEIFKL